MIFSVLLILDTGTVSVWDFFRSEFGHRGLDLQSILF